MHYKWFYSSVRYSGHRLCHTCYCYYNGIQCHSIPTPIIRCDLAQGESGLSNNCYMVDAHNYCCYCTRDAPIWSCIRCWIVETPKYLRYVLTHGWKCLFILVEIVLYTYLHFFIRRHFRNLSRIMDSPIATGAPRQCQDSMKTVEVDEGSEVALVYMKSDDVDRRWFHVISHQPEQWDPRYRPIQRILLLNVYPIAFIILWIPGIANRFLELTGHTSYVTQLLQALTQFVGLANALTYGWNESITRQLFRRSDLRGDNDV
ncbi:hypothetical protein BDQ17DRAFT_758594 [Cyathus striatus]|nr:hypothetical protein BDQ17DRAFT_758594 [Cyathus striatus]